MSVYSTANLGSITQVQVDLSEEKRLAQIKRIEELKSRIGDIQPLPWLGQNHIGGQDRDQHFASDIPGSPSKNPRRFGENNDWSQGTSPEFLPQPTMRLISNGSGMNDWRGHGNPHPLKSRSLNAKYEQPPAIPHFTDHIIEIADSNSQSTRLTNSPSKGSVRSSNTSTDTFFDNEIKMEIEESITLNSSRNHIMPKTHTFRSANSSGLSEAQNISTSQSLKTSAQKRRRTSKELGSQFSRFKPRTSIPSNIDHEELASQGYEAAVASRLNPYVLHHLEYQLLRDHICHAHVTAYLNIRNRILRLWVRNPLVTVTPEEAAGCAYSTKWLGLAEVAYEFLLRRGYINFGCVEVPDLIDVKARRNKSKDTRKTIVVIGAGMAGLGCARQLEGLFNHYRDKWLISGEEPPRVVLLEGRSRIGGRIYSLQLHNQDAKGIPKNSRCTAEMGAHIIVGFIGNPLNMIVRGQLALHYHPLRDNSTLFDIDGEPVDKTRDRLVQELYNDILDRASVYRHKIPVPTTVEGDHGMIDSGRDPAGEAGKPISQVEGQKKRIINQPATLGDQGMTQVPAGVDKLTGKAHLVPGLMKKAPPAVAAEAMGWKVASSILARKDLDLEPIAKGSPFPTLGDAMDEGVKQYQMLLDLTPQDLRMLNWHFANLEYANAANVGKLSLGGWDQDVGNEFEGGHAQVVGGYSQVPRGLFQHPFPLDLHTKKGVKQISYNPNPIDRRPSRVICEDGEVIEADQIVLTAPLGVLKDNSIKFDPPLPHWKQESINKLGFGTLNKVVLVYEKPFWDLDQDMIGLLRDTDNPNSRNQDDYSKNRGKFYLFWNCVKTTGRPMLISLMAGDAAHNALFLTDAQIISEVTHQLAKMYKQTPVPVPTEAVVTRWQRDRFARGSYSYVAPESHSDDYDSMAKPIGNLHFAGEATCGTHPATVHGAYISGLRAASDVLDSLLGPISIPAPLVPTAAKAEVSTTNEPKPTPPGRQTNNSAPMTVNGETPDQKGTRLEALEKDIVKTIVEKLGPCPIKGKKTASNPFLLYSSEHWEECKARIQANDLSGKAPRNDVRALLGRMWNSASAEVKQPYHERTAANRNANQESATTFELRLAAWSSDAMGIRREYVKSHPGVLSKEEERDMWNALGVYNGTADRRAKKASGYADESGDEGMGG